MTPAKKPPAKKPQRRPPATPRRPKGKPGPTPVVLRGFDRRILNPAWLDIEEPPDPWTRSSPARRALLVLRSGGTWTLAADAAKINEGTLHRWNSRGRDVMGDQDDLATLFATRPDDETLAMAAFHVLATQAIVMPGVTALNTITRASGTEWRAALALLRIHPATKKDYAEVTKLEHSGPDGEPIPIETRAAGLAARLRDRMHQADYGDDEQPDADTAGEG